MVLCLCVCHKNVNMQSVANILSGYVKPAVDEVCNMRGCNFVASGFKMCDMQN